MKKPPLIPTVLVLFFVVLMLNLGFWQLSRAKEKQHLLTLIADDNVIQLKTKKQLKELPQYATIKIKGHYLKQPQLLLDNQINGQQLGYHVFTAFFIDALNSYIMINRGWINPTHNKSLEVDESPTQLIGRLNHAPRVGYQLGEQSLKNKHQQLITYYDSEIIQPFLQEKLCQSLDCWVTPRILWLNPDQQQGFERNWKPIIMPPSKHIGYAVQWFSMTFVLIVIYIYWLRKTVYSLTED